MLAKRRVCGYQEEDSTARTLDIEGSGHLADQPLAAEPMLRVDVGEGRKLEAVVQQDALGARRRPVSRICPEAILWPVVVRSDRPRRSEGERDFPRQSKAVGPDRVRGNGGIDVPEDVTMHEGEVAGVAKVLGDTAQPAANVEPFAQLELPPTAGILFHLRDRWQFMAWLAKTCPHQPEALGAAQQ